MQKSRQHGQTLIETVVAIFILVMGVTAAVGLAIYALNASSNVNKQIIATGLAREGIESVKNMRDTNWLKVAIVNSCYNYLTATNEGYCYDLWLGNKPGYCPGSWNNSGNDRGFCLNPGASGVSTSYTLESDPDPDNKAWDFDSETTNFGLDFNTNITASGFSGYYTPASSANGSSDYYRKITLTKDSSAPYTTNMERLEVVSQVWWTDKKCPRSATWEGSSPRCRIELRTYLTNWKDY